MRILRSLIPSFGVFRRLECETGKYVVVKHLSLYWRGRRLQIWSRIVETRDHWWADWWKEGKGNP